MRGLLKPIFLIAVVLAIPIVPFMAFGPSLEERIEREIRTALAPETVALMVVGLLAVDIFLPIPSSVVSTVAGSVLGFGLGTAASWLGMTLGAGGAFLLARLLGRSLALRFSNAEDLGRIDVLSARYGPMVLVLARPVPILAEASVLFLGATRLSWSRFLVPIALSNLGIAAAYAALGELVQLPVALAASIALPLVLTALARWGWKRTKYEGLRTKD
ncbi:MAG: VTT domain-containing protein [Thermoguttaceae bacterium]|jgi:uncharacterized membrane protein YdjX (TVP38/TMEM64 family)